MIDPNLGYVLVLKGRNIYATIPHFSFLPTFNVITGFNTDIEFEGVTYHVQTEDKGLATPIILSLVYNRGTILASKRAPYEDLVSDGFDEVVLEERLQRQHRLICAAVKAGRIDDLKKMSSGLPALAVSEAVPVKTRKRKASKAAADESTAYFPDFETEPAIPMPEFEYDPELLGGPIVDVISIIEEPMMLPDEAVEIVSDMAGKERRTNNRLCLELLSEEKFKGGETKTVSVMVLRGSGRKVVAGAEIMVKIIGSDFRPLIFHSTTDKNGLANVTLQLPNFRSGRAAFLVRAMSGGEQIELRRSISQG